MAIYRLLQQSAFTPEQIRPMVAPYEDCLRALKLADRSDPITEIVAKSIIGVAQTGESDPARICRLALENIGIVSGQAHEERPDAPALPKSLDADHRDCC